MTHNLLFKQITCPFCETIIKKKKIIDFDNKYIKCPNENCLIVYIPRNKDVRSELISLYKEYCDEISCLNINCQRKYNPYSVIHNNQWSVCPQCNFKNPYSLRACLTIQNYFLDCNLGRHYEYEIYYDYDCDSECTFDSDDNLTSDFLPEWLPRKLLSDEEYSNLHITHHYSKYHWHSLKYLPKI